MITVVDTGHKLIQSVNLKWLKISFPTVTSPTSAIVFKTDTIFERLGSVNYYLIDENSYCPAQTYDAGRTGSLRCYSDNQIINYKRVSTTCDYIFIPGPPSSLNSYLINTLDVKVFPNPTAEKLIMLLENNTKQKYQISLQNNLGQIVSQKQFEPTSNELELDVKDLPKGIYFLKLTSANNQSFTQKIIKE